MTHSNSIDLEVILKAWAAGERDKVGIYLDSLIKARDLLPIETDNPLDDKIKMTPSQSRAWENILRWLAGSSPFFCLKGYAGTGKSFLQQKLNALNYNFLFSAPTNKATKVLASFLGYNCKTTYSLLGLRMVNEEDKLVLSASKIPDLGSNPILVIDECGMLASEIVDIILRLVDRGVRFLFVGDPAQLNPVGESRSRVWSLAAPVDRSMLTDIVRFDNQLLDLSVAIRTCIKNREFDLKIEDDNDGKDGVFVVNSRKFDKLLTQHSKEEWRTRKVVCWRNKTVERYTSLIRASLGFKGEYQPSDLIMLATPLMEGQTIKAYVDEEFEIATTEPRNFSFPEGSVASNVLSLANSDLTINVPQDKGALSAILSHRASVAGKQKTRADRQEAWRKFWELKNHFTEIRYGYAMTCHRVQGTTLEHAYMDKTDILANRDDLEAYRCLYVGATRPQFSLTTF